MVQPREGGEVYRVRQTATVHVPEVCVPGWLVALLAQRGKATCQVAAVRPETDMVRFRPVRQIIGHLLKLRGRALVFLELDSPEARTSKRAPFGVTRWKPKVVGQIVSK
eukprot:scaffold123162_cov66-Phaeocystis_antarctica.AAC.4